MIFCVTAGPTDNISCELTLYDVVFTRGSCQVLITSTSGKTVCEFDFDVQQRPPCSFFVLKVDRHPFG